MAIKFEGNGVSWVACNDRKFSIDFPEHMTDSQTGIAHTANGLGLGAICLIENSNRQLVVCRKAAVKGYEFSNQLVFPGGAVRRNQEAVGDLFQQTISSLNARVAKEAGVQLDVENATMADEPVFTMYTVKEIMRYMMVIPFYATVEEQVIPDSMDHSTTSSFFAEPNEQLLNQLAPANALALVNFKSSEFDRQLSGVNLEKRSKDVALCVGLRPENCD